MIKREFFYLGWYILLCIPIIILYIRFSTKAKREWLMLTGQIKPEVSPEYQRREYIRLESVMPVEFQKQEGDAAKEADIYQGFSKDISKTGLCIETLTVRGKAFETLVPNKTKLKLFINTQPDAKAIVTHATVRWVRTQEDMTVDKHYIGVSYDNAADPELAKVLKVAYWFKKKPDISKLLLVITLLLTICFGCLIAIYRSATSQLEGKIREIEHQRSIIVSERDLAREEIKDLEKEIGAITEGYASFSEALAQRQENYPKSFPVLPKPVEDEEELIDEPLYEEPEEELTEEEVEEALEPIVELRTKVKAEDEIVIEPNITRKMIEDEKDIYKSLRDYILKEEIQRLDRYTSQHRASIYHAAAVFALAELRYKNYHIKEMTMKVYNDVIILYPNSKYASYASHRLEQLERNLPYNSYSLKYYHTEYNLPALYDYRELEPYKE